MRCNSASPLGNLRAIHARATSGLKWASDINKRKNRDRASQHRGRSDDDDLICALHVKLHLATHGRQASDNGQRSKEVVLPCLRHRHTACVCSCGSNSLPIVQCRAVRTLAGCFMTGITADFHCRDCISNRLRTFRQWMVMLQEHVSALQVASALPFHATIAPAYIPVPIYPKDRSFPSGGSHHWMVCRCSPQPVHLDLEAVALELERHLSAGNSVH